MTAWGYAHAPSLVARIPDTTRSRSPLIVRIICSKCGAWFPTRRDGREVLCPSCRHPRPSYDKA
jgi:rubrerythrin